MTLIGFRARNHVQQRINEEVDDRATTPDVFDPLHERHNFTVDVAAAEHNTKLPRYYTRLDDGLAQSWASERVWCNPPYSHIRPWIEKAWHELVDDPHPSIDGQLTLGCPVCSTCSVAPVALRWATTAPVST